MLTSPSCAFYWSRAPLRSRDPQVRSLHKHPSSQEGCAVTFNCRMVSATLPCIFILWHTLLVIVMYFQKKKLAHRQRNAASELQSVPDGLSFAEGVLEKSPSCQDSLVPGVSLSLPHRDDDHRKDVTTEFGVVTRKTRNRTSFHESLLPKPPLHIER
jgi:hypothetical protein